MCTLRHWTWATGFVSRSDTGGIVVLQEEAGRSHLPPQENEKSESEWCGHLHVCLTPTMWCVSILSLQHARRRTVPLASKCSAAWGLLNLDRRLWFISFADWWCSLSLCLLRNASQPASLAIDQSNNHWRQGICGIANCSPPISAWSRLSGQRMRHRCPDDPFTKPNSNLDLEAGPMRGNEQRTNYHAWALAGPNANDHVGT
jgi:hypothetical protein